MHPNKIYKNKYENLVKNYEELKNIFIVLIENKWLVEEILSYKKIAQIIVQPNQT